VKKNCCWIIVTAGFVSCGDFSTLEQLLAFQETTAFVSQLETHLQPDGQNSFQKITHDIVEHSLSGSKREPTTMSLTTPTQGLTLEGVFTYSIRFMPCADVTVVDVEHALSVHRILRKTG
jgi:hypothetical protein